MAHRLRHVLIAGALGLALTACSAFSGARPATLPPPTSTPSASAARDGQAPTPAPSPSPSPTRIGVAGIATAALSGAGATPVGVPTPRLTASPTPTTAAYGATLTPEGNAWEGLQRPLQLPVLAAGAPCPRSATQRGTVPDFPVAGGDGPIHVTPWDTEGVYDVDRRYPNSEGWFSRKMLFIVATPSYRGPILVRGRQLDGPTEIRFQESLGGTLDEEKRLDNPPGRSATNASLHWGGYTLWQAEGCYALQFDGSDFSQTIVFQVVYR